jgi:hypothetical protein
MSVVVEAGHVGRVPIHYERALALAVQSGLLLRALGR